MILSVGIRQDVYEFVNSGFGRVLMIIAIYAIIRSYGVVAGVLSAVAVVAILMSPSREGMETKDDDSKEDDSKDDTDDESDEKDDTDNESDEKDDTDNESDDIETKTANDNQQGTQSQLDMDRGMKMASHKNSQNQEETVEQMKKEKQKEGFSNMMGVGDMFKSTPCAV
jgi:FtsZ-interacting cell division protein ZipA